MEELKELWVTWHMYCFIGKCNWCLKSRSSPGSCLLTVCARHVTSLGCNVSWKDTTSFLAPGRVSLSDKSWTQSFQWPVSSATENQLAFPTFSQTKRIMHCSSWWQRRKSYCWAILEIYRPKLFLKYGIFYIRCFKWWFINWQSFASSLFLHRALQFDKVVALL